MKLHFIFENLFRRTYSAPEPIRLTFGSGSKACTLRTCVIFKNLQCSWCGLYQEVSKKTEKDKEKMWKKKGKQLSMTHKKTRNIKIRWYLVCNLKL